MTEQLGCYFCFAQLKSSDIKEWTDGKKPICPRCGIDTIAETWDREELNRLNKYLTYQ